MEGIATITMEVAAMDAETKSRLDEEVAGLGLQGTLPESEGATLHLPNGTYGAVLEIDDRMKQFRHYYRGLVDIMRKLGFKGRYFVNVAENPAFVCGEL